MDGAVLVSGSNEGKCIPQNKRNVESVAYNWLLVKQ